MTINISEDPIHWHYEVAIILVVVAIAVGLHLWAKRAKAPIRGTFYRCFEGF